MNEVTRYLNAIEQGDPNGAAELLPLVYDELRKLAAANMARERPDHTLDATALVHEAYLRLVGDQAYADRRHFFRVAATSFASPPKRCGKSSSTGPASTAEFDTEATGNAFP
jgi:ECF sigma factor